MSWNRRLMMGMAVGGDSLPDYSAYRGVYIEDVEGFLYTEDEWDGSKTANGIAVLTDNCRFVIALQDAHSSAQWGNPEFEVDEITTTEYVSEAIVDYDGELQTKTIVRSIGASDNIDYKTAAYYCYYFVFPNGNCGYLGAAGEWKAVLDNKKAIESALSKCGGDVMNRNYWTSTQYSFSNSWRVHLSFDSLYTYEKYYFLSVRAFATLKSDEWSE